MNKALQQAARALNDGQAAQAVETCQKLLAAHPGHPDCEHLLGVALITAGEVASGSRLLDELVSERPRDIEVRYNHASALLSQDLPAEALKRFEQVLAIDPTHLAALNNRGSALLALGRMDEARSSYQALLKRAPDHARAWFNLGNLELAEARLEAARDAYGEALRRQPAYEQALTAFGSVQLELGHAAAALPALTQATQLDRGNATAWRLQGQALAGLNRFDEALAAATRATELAPESAEAWNSLGSQLTALGRLEESEEALRCALDLDPALVVAWANLAALLELANRLDACSETLAAAQERFPDHSGLALTQARLWQRQKRYPEALAALETLSPTAPTQVARDGHFLRGQILDRLGRFSAAFEHYEQGNAMAAEEWRRGNPETDQLFPAMGRLLESFTSAFVDRWPEPESGSYAEPVFLLSFQRSGTTLLDTMLGAHPQVQVMEEQPALNAVVGEIRGYPELLETATADTVAAWRERYWSEVQRLAGFTPVDGRVLLDKSPLHTVHLGLIQRMFPTAPVIFALRHPLDVVLSCLMQDFTLSPFMLRYATLQGVSEVYRRVMDLWQQYRALLPLNVIESRYEELVVAPEERMRSLLAFLKLPWDEAVLDNVGQARGRGLINTPSYHQVSQPLYASSSYRWRNYRAELEPVMDELRPYCEFFGYETP
ncbi:MAG: sulfotransferase [Pseudomonadota bacterium]